ncbi:MAG TPA: hypothetical protein VLZ06_05065 [Solirubrobacteraceae bacterium]|nr:hypothetical protein [Solirubrobacteraceae bacterium]
MRPALAVLAALALAGCETTAEESARLERAAKRSQHVSEAREPLKALLAAPPSSKVVVRGTAIVHTAEGTAAVVTVHNLTASTLRKVPILIYVKDSTGRSLYTNNQPGISVTLTSVPSVPGGGSVDWVDDQVQAAGTPAGVFAKLGEGGGGSSPLHVSAHVSEQNASGGTVEGTVSNPTATVEQEVVVYGVARRGGRVTAAGRAVLTEVPAHGASHMQLFLIGDPSGAKLQLSAAPTS